MIHLATKQTQSYLGSPKIATNYLLQEIYLCLINYPLPNIVLNWPGRLASFPLRVDKVTASLAVFVIMVMKWQYF